MLTDAYTKWYMTVKEALSNNQQTLVHTFKEQIFLIAVFILSYC